MDAPIFLSSLVVAAVVPTIGSAQLQFQGPTHHLLAGAQPQGVVTGDFNAQNGIDFAVTTSSASGDRVEIFRNQGNGTFAHVQALALGTGVGPGEVAAADLDGDQDLDLAISLTTAGTVAIAVNLNGNYFVGGSVPVGGLAPHCIAAADLDGDGDVDIATANRGSNDVSVLLNAGNGTFALGSVLAVGAGPRDVALDDFDGDCRTDVAVAAYDAHTVDVYLNQGGGFFGGLFSVPVPDFQEAAGLFAADLDTDGDVDLVTSSDDGAGAGVVVVLRNSGGGFTTQGFASGGTEPGSVLVADFDGDGVKDVAVTDGPSNLVNALPGGTNAALGSAIALGTHPYPSNLAGADFDGNGSIDLVVVNRDMNTVSVFRNGTTGGTNTLCITTPNSAGFGTRIDTRGSVSVAQNDFTLLARCSPVNSFGLFFFGPGNLAAPFGNGHRCVSGPIVRLGPAGPGDATGHAVKLFDFTAPAATGVGPGSTRYFQYWHRDVQAGGSNFDLSDALRATFRP